jgi:hypothetical protein
VLVHRFPDLVALLVLAGAISACPGKELDDFCSDNDECREGLTCIGENERGPCGSLFTPCHTGICSYPGSIGDRCTEDTECREGLSCETGSESQDFDSLRCSCNDDGDCEGDLVCRRSGEHRECLCTGDEQCPAGQYCNSEYTPSCSEESLRCLSDPRCTCKTDDDCDGDLVCRTWNEWTSLCTCETDEQCPPGRFCDRPHPEAPAYCALR